MKYRTLFVLLVVCTTGCAKQDLLRPSDWLDDSQATFSKEYELPEKSFSEVRVTRLMTAVDRLNEVCAIPLTEKLAKYYTGPMYRIEEGTTPYLVRGLFANYTGGHTLYYSDGVLTVRHDSLGSGFEPMFSPLVVNLVSEPRHVAIFVSGAR